MVLFDLDDTLMAHRAAVAAGIALHMAERAYEAEHAGRAAALARSRREHYHAYLAVRLTFEGSDGRAPAEFALAHGEELDELAAGAWFARYFERYRDSWSLHDDVLPALDALENAIPGVRFGIITNGELDSSRRSSTGSACSTGSPTSSPRATSASRSPTLESSSGRSRSSCPMRPSRRPPTSATVSSPTPSALPAGLLGVWLNRTGATMDDDEATSSATVGVVEVASLTELAPVLAERLTA